MVDANIPDTWACLSPAALLIKSLTDKTYREGKLIEPEAIPTL